MSTTSTTHAAVLPLPVAPAEVKSGADRFLCPKMHATLTATECKKRYETAYKPTGGKSDAKKRHLRMAVNSAALCKGCTLGPTTIHPKVRP
jgi:hypothetical protein